MTIYEAPLASPFGRGGRAKRGRRGEARVQDPLRHLRWQLSQRESQGVVPLPRQIYEKWSVSAPIRSMNCLTNIPRRRGTVSRRKVLVMMNPEHPEKARNRFCVFPPAFRGSMFVIVRYLPETGTLLFRITSCEPPSTMLVEETSVSFAFLRRSARFSTPQLHIVERTLPRVTARLSLRLPA